MRISTFRRAAWLAAAIACLSGCDVRGDEVRVAVAANFASTLRELVVAFESASGYTVTITSGSTGLLYAQIRRGAPFDLLLSADQRRPELLAADGYGERSSIFTYAVGRLALWSADPRRVSDASLALLDEADFRWLAIAEPDIAPYGLAARQTLERLDLWADIADRLVRAQNVAQAFAMAETGNAELALIAAAQALRYRGPSSYAIVPDELHEPIRQDAILLRAGLDNTAAREFVQFLRSATAVEILTRSGYSVPGAFR